MDKPSDIRLVQYDRQEAQDQGDLVGGGGDGKRSYIEGWMVDTTACVVAARCCSVTGMLPLNDPQTLPRNLTPLISHSYFYYRRAPRKEVVSKQIMQLLNNGCLHFEYFPPICFGCFWGAQRSLWIETISGNFHQRRVKYS